MLLEATKQGRIFMVNYLLDKNSVDINVTDKDGHTALISACLLDDNKAATRRKLVRLFLAKNANVNLVDNSGRNALMWACYLGKIDVVKILFGRSLVDLDFSLMDRTGNTALHYASSNGHYTLTRMLVEAMKRFGVSLDGRNKEGMTALLAATKNGKEMCAGVLLENGASPDIVDPQTSMNVKELAENSELQTLVQQITIRYPRTLSRCSFPRQPDDDDMRSAIGSREGSVSLQSPTTSSRRPSSQTEHDENRTKETQTPLLVKRKKMDGKLKSGKNSPRSTLNKNLKNLLEMENLNPFLTQSSSVDSSKTPSPRPASECSFTAPFLEERTTECKRIQTKSSSNPYDLRELRSVLSLYGEQQAPTYRKGFSTPIMTEEKFQDHLTAMSPKPQWFISSPRSSIARSSTSSIALSPLLQQRRRSVLLKEYNLRSANNSTDHSRRHTISLGARRKDRPLLRNLSDPLMDQKQQPFKRSNSRRLSLMITTHLENGTK